jgi:hypothetical protein
MKLSMFSGFVFGALLLFSSVAQADNFSFSFSNDPAFGNMDGTVTGKIFGLTDNATSSATDVIIDRYPASLIQFGSYSTPVDVSTWTNSFVYENSFTVVNDQITGGAFSIVDSATNDVLLINSSLLGGGDNYLSIGSFNGSQVWDANAVGSTGVTFVSTPEPSSLSFLLVAGLVAGLTGLRKNLQDAKTEVRPGTMS